MSAFLVAIACAAFVNLCLSLKLGVTQLSWILNADPEFWQAYYRTWLGQTVMKAALCRDEIARYDCFDAR
jgi:hypothetical protein